MSIHQTLRLTCGLLSAGMLLLPMGLIPLSIGMQPAYFERVEKRAPTAFPTLSPSTARDRQAVRAAYYAVRDRFPYKGSLVEAVRILDIYAFGKRRFNTADLGEENWTYYRESYWSPEVSHADIQSTLATLEQFLGRLQARPQTDTAQVRLVIAPDKHTIYPEYLSEQGQIDRARTAEARQAVHDWFKANSDDPRIIDMWSMIHRSKGQSEYLYVPNDTHHSPMGAAVMAQAIVDSIDSKAWYRESIAAGAVTPYTDVAFNMGLFQHQLHVQESFTLYSGVAVRSPQTTVHSAGKTFDSEATAIQQLCADQGLPESCLQNNLTQYHQPASRHPLIAAKTLIVHDSFMNVFTKDILRPLFNDVSFIHHNVFTAEDLEASLSQYDYIVVQSSERLAFGTPKSSDNTINRLFRPLETQTEASNARKVH